MNKKVDNDGRQSMKGKEGIPTRFSKPHIYLQKHQFPKPILCHDSTAEPKSPFLTTNSDPNPTIPPPSPKLTFVMAKPKSHQAKSDIVPIADKKGWKLGTPQLSMHLPTSPLSNLLPVGALAHATDDPPAGSKNRAPHDLPCLP